MSKPTFLGRVGAVSGATISVKLSEGVASGISIIGGRSYRIGQVGGFVRIPQGYHDLYGIVSEVGASATPESIIDQESDGHRWMSVQLVGEIVEANFERGISQYPGINDEVHLVTEEDLRKIYGNIDAGQVAVGRLSGAESISVRLDLDKLVTRHSAVLGSTGSGKSTTIASLLHAIAGDSDNGVNFPNARILLLDIHGEYAKALDSVATVFSVYPSEGEKRLCIPYWALHTEDLLPFLFGNLSDAAFTGISDKIYNLKMELAKNKNFDGIDVNSITADTPIPFSIKGVWFDLLDPELKTWANKERTEAAIEEAGSAESLTPPVYQLPGAGSALPHMNKEGVLGIRRQLDQLRSRLLDRQFDFMLNPGEWSPDLEGSTDKDLAALLSSWLGHEKPITVLDLSGVPSVVLIRLIGGILNIIYEALFWGRGLPVGGRERPLLVVMEEAHRYLGKEEKVQPAKSMVQRIVKEGRKFGIGAMIVSQRPSEIDETILSQCGTFLTLRLSNSSDRNRVQATLPDSLSALMESLPVLRTGEAIITGEAAMLPIRCRINIPANDARPNSGDPEVTSKWSKDRIEEDYEQLAAVWRARDTRWRKKEE